MALDKTAIPGSAWGGTNRDGTGYGDTLAYLRMSLFNLVFRNFIQVFCKAEHPLVLYLDDLQWADSLSLKLMEDILADDTIKYLFLIGA